MPTMHWLDERSLSKLRWRCRRGLLENDLFIDRFFAEQQGRISVEHGEALTRLMDLPDNDLLDLLLARKEPQALDAELDVPPIHALLALMRRAPQNH